MDPEKRTRSQLVTCTFVHQNWGAGGGWTQLATARELRQDGVEEVVQLRDGLLRYTPSPSAPLRVPAPAAGTAGRPQPWPRPAAYGLRPAQIKRSNAQMLKGVSGRFGPLRAASGRPERPRPARLAPGHLSARASFSSVARLACPTGMRAATEDLAELSAGHQSICMSCIWDSKL